MTRTEIHRQVFNGNVSADALSGSLQILHELDHARCRKELTGGALSERSFVTSKVTNLTK